MEIYEINKIMENLLDLGEEWVNTETGEVLSFAEIEGLQMERAEKLENWGLWIKNRRAELEAIKAEIDSLTERKKALEHKIEVSQESYKGYLNGEKLSTGRISVSYRKSSSVEFDGDVEALPEALKTVRVEVKPNKTEIKKAITAGMDVPGARIVEKVGLVIK